jgi:micrococcal nuclease
MARFSGDPATLSSDPTQDASDRYGRLLRYIEVGHRDLGALALSRGLVMPYRFRNPAVRYRRYRVLARQAAAGRRGTWGSPCNGDFHSSLPGTQNGL